MFESSEHMEKVTQGLLQACDEVNTNCHQSVNAMVEATAAMSKGCEEFSRKLGTLIQESMSHAMKTGKIMMSAKSIKEIGELQSEYAKNFFDQWLEGTGHLSEISARVTQEALSPVAKHANDAMSKAAELVRQGRAA